MSDFTLSSSTSSGDESPLATNDSVCIVACNSPEINALMSRISSPFESLFFSIPSSERKEIAKSCAKRGHRRMISMRGISISFSKMRLDNETTVRKNREYLPGTETCRQQRGSTTRSYPSLSNYFESKSKTQFRIISNAQNPAADFNLPSASCFEFLSDSRAKPNPRTPGHRRNGILIVSYEPIQTSSLHPTGRSGKSDILMPPF